MSRLDDLQQHSLLDNQITPIANIFTGDRDSICRVFGFFQRLALLIFCCHGSLSSLVGVKTCSEALTTFN